MRRSIFMYLFLFAALWIVFQYVNASKSYDNQQDKIERLEAKLAEANDSLASIDVNASRYFKLTGNENAYDYFDRFGVDIIDLESRIETALVSKNSTSGNDLIPYENATGVFQINKVEVLNHKWVIADFSDGARWGELILLYDVEKDGSIRFETLQSVIYP
ncbi:hypothetical protein [Leeuwenhoekiella nanhaiensis]|uniref:Hydrolase n=1 Tax=Leeuwenhoekiella nanhaiensis TaxID=1655491 RepID=A0A2G1VUN7_9FLAO|nr:hypothetical protein [Leeuwenhoekiella nanhaiensis]PHQ30493.1 hypothetical protein CJ305_05930 [Leeuwenhoekiella nanhaiensis]